MRAHTAGYATDPAFHRHWLGFSKESRDLRAQQLRCFAELVGSVTQSLADRHVLDVGCGDGRWLRTFLEFDAKAENLKGIDVSDVRFDLARGKNPLIVLRKTDGTTIPFEDERFDLVTQFVCFSSIPTESLRQSVAAEIRRVLKKGGFVFWWDVPVTVSPGERGVRLQPSDLFDWPIRRLDIGPMPLPGECVRPMKGLSRLLRPFIDLLAYPRTHVAALIGPKPS